MKIALVGNQNCGKTTLFNALTGLNQKIGNWPGVTLERKIGIIKETNYEIVDLPGIYSLSPYTSEECVSRDFILNEKPDVIINILDATNLERSLYLTTQLLELDTKIIIALNMEDLLEKKHIKIDTKQLSSLLKTPVYSISAYKESGIEELIKGINKLKNKKSIKIYEENIENAIEEISFNFDNHKRFFAVKVLEEDKNIGLLSQKLKKITNKLSKNYNISLEEEIATERYNFIENVTMKCYERRNHVSNTDKLDKIFLNKWLAIPIFIIIMFLIYFLSVGVVGSNTNEFLSSLIDSLTKHAGELLFSLNVSNWLISLVKNGILAGVGAVIGFIPQLFILFLLISLLEVSGYMSRISLLLDRMFRKIGLSGKALIPFIVGCGCSVPGIMTTRILEDENERKMTSILTPFIPCSAKLPIIALFSGYFFDEYSGLVSASLYFFAIVIIMISAFIMKKFIYKGNTAVYVSELPDYKIPDIKYVLKDVFDKVMAFVKRAGTIILLCSIIIWFLLSFSFDLHYNVSIDDSILATIGKKISWIFYPLLGTNSWAATVSAMQGLVAKEQVVSSMAVIAGFSEDVNTSSVLFNHSSIFGFFTPLSAYSFMVFNLFSAPCFGAIGAMRKELGSVKYMLKAITFQMILAWILGTLIFQIGSLFI
jgi:ferrous iron transport protein B